MESGGTANERNNVIAFWTALLFHVASLFNASAYSVFIGVNVQLGT